MSKSRFVLAPRWVARVAVTGGIGAIVVLLFAGLDSLLLLLVGAAGPALTAAGVWWDGVELRVDLGVINDRVFVNNASFGAYASVVRSPAYRNDKVGTPLRILPDLLAHRNGPRLGMRAGGVTVEQPQAVLVSNNPYRTYDPAGLGHRERLDSGVLGVLGVKVGSAAQAARVLCGPGAPGLAQLTAWEVVIEADADAIPVGVDGEALNLSTPVRCRIRPGALRVRVPRDRPGVPRSKPPMIWNRVRRLGLTAIRKAEEHEK
ncbi:diacylglycerol/lipid kinase family protein [Streptomyces sp. NPDC057428]|uniref:diacylglycerol/lipid kinase family protein n=1 Tax=Streptomyces sp. NPDC057428 TaxID=3346129 RepID=UPI0036809F76